MSWHRKVAWQEGAFIRPQHFQQQDRHLEWSLASLTHQLHSYGWGISELEFDVAALRLGHFVIKKCRAFLPDGSVIDMPSEDGIPDPIVIQEKDEGLLIYLALPIWRAGANDIDRQNADDSNARYRLSHMEVPDIVSSSNSAANIELASKKVRVVTERDGPQQYSAIAIAKVKSVKNKAIELDERFIPAALDVQSSAALVNIIRDVQGLAQKRTILLAERLKSLADGNGVEMADFLLLQMLNRYQPILEHYLTADSVHPERVYQLFAQLASELATFTHQDKRLASVPPYLHDDLQVTFESFEPLLQQPLSLLLDQSAIQIELENKGFGIRIGYIPQLESSASFVLCARAEMPNEELRRQLPMQAKIGSIERINNLVNKQLPGIQIDPLASAPRQIPFYSGAVYFELKTQGKWWQDVVDSKGLALHVGSQFPGISLELWVIK
ncbi:MAG: type VI secretion system baseplate subunit TssK [Marinomonas gallaica]